VQKLGPVPRKVLNEVARRGVTTRAEVASACGIPKATAASVIDGLIRHGLLSEGDGDGPAPSGGDADPAPAGAARPAVGVIRGRRPGRPPRLLRLTGPPALLGALVWSGGRLRAAVGDFAGRVLASTTMAMPGEAGTEGVIEPGYRLLGQVLPQVGSLRGVVLGVPAPFQPGVGLSPGVRSGDADFFPSYAQWLARDPARQLSELTGVATLVENDANLSALGEAQRGAGRELSSFLFLRLSGKSTGAGLIFDGRLHRGATGFAGELAHIHISDDGPLCACGGRGCLTSQLGPALVATVQAAYDQPLTFADVLVLAQAGDPGPRRILGDLGRTLGRTLADFCTIVNPAAIVVDGSLGGAADLVCAGIREMIDRYAAPAAAAAVAVRPGLLGDDADLIGALLLGREALSALDVG
jgi:predicted NBD/HSP70 family sugar kinase